MTESSEADRELEGTRIYFGSPWLAEFKRKHFGNRSGKDDAES